MKKSLLLCILAAIGFGVAPTVIQLAIRAGVSQVSCVLYNNILLMLVCLIMCKAGRHSLRISGKKVLPLLLMGACGMGFTVFLLTMSYQYIAVGTATVIQFLYPSIVTVACAVFMHRRLGPSAYLAIVLSILGLLFISVIGSGSTHFRPMGFLLALASAFTYSFYIFGNEYFKIGELPVWSAVFYMAAAAGTVFAVINAVSGQFTLPATGSAALFTFGAAAISSFSFLLLNIGIAGIGAAQASFATLIEPITAVVCGVIVLHEKVTVFTFIGIVLILLAVWINSAPAEKKAPAKLSGK